MSFVQKLKNAGAVSTVGVLSIANGGTNANTADGALDSLGGTAVGKAVLKAASEDAAQGAIGATATGKAVLIAASQSAAQDAVGATATGKSLLTAANAGAARTAVGGGANKVMLTIQNLSLVGASAKVGRIVTQVAGTIDKVYSVTDLALATGNATLTGKIGASAITNGVITHTQSGSAAGDSANCTPSAANTVSVGDVISFTCGGTNTASATANISILITPSA